MSKKRSAYSTIMTIIFTSLITFTITSLWQYGKIEKKADTTEEVIGKALKTDALTSKFQLIKNNIDSGFVGEVDEEKLKEYAVKGYVAGLDDEYSQYFTKDEMKKYTEETLGNYVGIGIYMKKNKEENTIVVHSVMEDTPAERAGIKAGDIIKDVEGKAITAEDFNTISDRIEGKEGTNVKIIMERDGEEIPFDIKRERIKIKSIKSELLDNKIGYIRLSSFDGDIAKEFKENYDKLLSQGMTSLIIDLRNNGGGVVTEAIEIADYFCEKDQKLLIETDKKGKETVTSAKTNREITMNVAVLVNENSASASEILAGIFKENVSNATIIGRTTYGKGVIQTLYRLSDGSGLKLTTNKYYTPNHNDINKEGIKPDIETEKYEFDSEKPKNEDPQLQKAIENLKNR